MGSVAVVCLCLFESPMGMEVQHAQIEGQVWVGDERGQEHAPINGIFSEGERGFLKEERASHTFSFMPTVASLN